MRVFVSADIVFYEIFWQGIEGDYTYSVIGYLSLLENGAIREEWDHRRGFLRISAYADVDSARPSFEKAHKIQKRHLQ